MLLCARLKALLVVVSSMALFAALVSVASAPAVGATVASSGGSAVAVVRPLAVGVDAVRCTQFAWSGVSNIGGTSSRDIWTVDRTAVRRQLSGIPGGVGTAADQRAVWSPDGEFIAWFADVIGSTVDTIHISSADGTVSFDMDVASVHPDFGTVLSWDRWSENVYFTGTAAGVRGIWRLWAPSAAPHSPTKVTTVDSWSGAGTNPDSPNASYGFRSGSGTARTELVYIADGPAGSSASGRSLFIGRRLGAPDPRPEQPSVEAGLVAYANLTGEVHIFKIADFSDTNISTGSFPASASARGPQLSPDGSRVAWVGRYLGVDEVFVARSDGTNRTIVSTGAVGNAEIQWSPDGRRVAWTGRVGARSQVFVAMADGTLLENPSRWSGLSNENNFGPRWSPDGRVLSWVRGSIGSRVLANAVVAAATAAVVPTPTFDNTDPAWRPTASALSLTAATTAAASGRIRVALTVTNTGVCTVGALSVDVPPLPCIVTGAVTVDGSFDGSTWTPPSLAPGAVARLEIVGAPTQPCSGLATIAHAVPAMTEGAWVAVNASLPAPAPSTCNSIYVKRGTETTIVDVAGSAPTVVTPAGRFLWSPDGTHFAAETNVGFGGVDGTVTIGSRSGSILVLPAVNVSYLAWSPTGAMVSWLGGASGREVHIVAIDGTGHRTLGTAARDSRGVAWSLSGTHVSWDTAPDTDGNRHLMVAAVDSGAVVDLGAMSILGRWHAWSPGESRIAWIAPQATGGHLMTAAADGSQRLDLGAAGRFWWSPDGSMLARLAATPSVLGPLVVGSATASDGKVLDAEAGTLSGVRWTPDGTHLAWVTRGRQLSYGTSDGASSATLGSAFDLGALSPDGSRIVIRRDGTTRGDQLAVVDLLTGTSVKLADLIDNSNASDAEWSADGTGIAWNDDLHGYVAAADGSSIIDLHSYDPGTGWSDSWDWSPTGARLALETFTGGVGRSWVVTVDGTIVWRTDSAYLAWSANGEYLATLLQPPVAGARDIGALAVSSIDGSGQRILDTWRGAQSWGWQPAEDPLQISVATVGTGLVDGRPGSVTVNLTDAGDCGTQAVAVTGLTVPCLDAASVTVSDGVVRNDVWLVTGIPAGSTMTATITGIARAGIDCKMRVDAARPDRFDSALAPRRLSTHADPIVATVAGAVQGRSCPSGGDPFVDVAGSFAVLDIACIYQLGVTRGTSLTTYSPHDAVTREQMAAFLARLWRAAGWSCPSGGDPFVDVAGSFAVLDIACIYQLGVTRGTSLTTYSPHDAVTREQMAAFLARLWRTLG